MSLDTLIPVRDPVPHRMRSRVDDVAGVLILRLGGEIDVSDVPALMADFDRALTRSHGVLVLDLEGVSFIDIAAMTVMVGSLRRAALTGCDVSLVSAGPRVRRVFALTGNEALLESSASLVDVEIAASIAPDAEVGGPDG